MLNTTEEKFGLKITGEVVFLRNTIEQKELAPDGNRAVSRALGERRQRPVLWWQDLGLGKVKPGAQESWLHVWGESWT